MGLLKGKENEERKMERKSILTMKNRQKNHHILLWFFSYACQIIEKKHPSFKSLLISPQMCEADIALF